jgi:crossover junction endodeoxyribonuclease RusA
VILSKRGREYRKACVSEVHRQLGGKPEPLTGRLSVHARFYPPDKRRRDLDNHWKSLLDALTHAGVWDDDCQIDHLVADREEKQKGGLAVVEVGELL